MNSARAVSWIVELQVELRNLLPSPYIISHAPVAPWFTSANDYSDGSYVAIHQQVGDTIDFYSVQFYNQGADQYVSCEVSDASCGGFVLKFFIWVRLCLPILGANGRQLLYSKSTLMPACPSTRLSLASRLSLAPLLMGTSFFFVDVHMFVFQANEDRSYMSASDLHQCVSEAKEKGWNAGVMFWEWSEVSASSSRTRCYPRLKMKMTDGVGYSFVCRRRLL